MNLNLRATSQNHFDAIVVGSGISGGWAAKELTEKGLTVLLLERGSPVAHPNYPTGAADPWGVPHGGRLTQDDRTKSYVQARHFSFQGDNKHFYINDQENPYEEKQRFDWIRGNVVGGRSLLWGRQSYRWSNLDFEANLRDGIAVDWPIRYEDIAPWYAYVERYIGISGQAEGIAHLPDSVFQPPMAMNCAEIDLRRRMKKFYPDRPVTIGRVANLTAPVKGRGTCRYRDACHRGCPYGAYFSTNSSTLPAAFETGRLTLRPNSIVNQVLYDEQHGQARGVEVIDAQTSEVMEFSARLIFLNAATLGTTFILLNSRSRRFPNGLGNDSDQVGRNIMDHHKQAGASCTVDGFEDQYYRGRRPNGLYIPRFRNLKEKHPDFIRGYGFQGEASRESWWYQASDQLGADLKTAAQKPGPWGFWFGGFGECLPYAENRATLNSTLRDKWGRPTLTLDVSFKENERAMNKDMAVTMAEMLETMGYQHVKPHQNMSFPGNANHEMGAARMGRDAKTSVLNGFNQMHAVKNVFITDGSCMTSASCVNPSLTYMALTARACDFAVGEINKGNL